MIGWLMIGIAIIIVFMFYKFKTMRHRIYAIFIVLLLLFFYFSGSRIIEKNNVDIKSFEGVVYASKLYFNWLFHVADNAKVLVGKAIDMDWEGENSTKER